jgi:hypothetical protein
MMMSYCGERITSLMSFMGEVEYSAPEALRLAPAIIGTPMVGIAKRKNIAE